MGGFDLQSLRNKHQTNPSMSIYLVCFSVISLETCDCNACMFVYTYEGKCVALAKYGKDLTEVARRGKVDPIIGRENEIRRCFDILSKKSKNNPVIIGEPGVGKTAIVEGLAQRVVGGDVPECFKNVKLISLNMGSLLAGARNRGDLEERILAVSEEATASNGEIVLFIDEIHTLVGSGATDGAVDVGNLLKPVLARGEFRCVGATTLNEYRKYIEKDGALERRFQPVFCNPLSVKDTISVLRGLRESYEAYHGVKISDGALVAAAELSARHITERFLPDKAIDLVDEAAAKLKLEMTSKPTELDEMDRAVSILEMERRSLQKETDKTSKERLAKLDSDLETLKENQNQLYEQWESERSLRASIRSITDKISRVNLQLEDAAARNDQDSIEMLKLRLLIPLRKLSEAEKKLSSFGESLLREEVTDMDIAQVVSKWTGIPLSSLQQSERDKLEALEHVLRKRVVGQDVAVSAVAKAMWQSGAGLSDPNKPIASFMFMGPTGVGKTELAKALASYLSNTENALVRVDMSEYKEKHMVSRLLGAPPGYVGHGESVQLTEAVRRRPYSVVLLDEMEKAHADVFDVLLPMLGEGRLTDSQGRTVSFTNSVVIMTSNIGSDRILKSKDAGYESLKGQVVELARKTFRPEFMNRIDEFIVFQPLDATQSGHVAEIVLNRVKDRLKQKKIDLLYTKEAAIILGELGFDPNFGARQVTRVVDQTVVAQLALGIVHKDFKEDDTIILEASASSQNGLRLRKLEGQSAAVEKKGATH